MNKREDLLKTGLDTIGIEWTEEDINRINQYVSEIELWNKKHSFVKASGDNLIIDHILDSLSPLKVLENYPFTTLADAGSGAGLPGIPLSLFLQDKKIFLIERSGKRSGFLRNEIGLLQLKNRVSVIESPVESVKNRFDAVTFRAFRQLDEYADYLFNLLKPGGFLFAYKGKRSVIDIELEKLGSPVRSEVIRVKVPFSDKERHLVILQRTR
ncbi:MAG: 16S rRNA (guanine(527)-N(7))-methyltransferase RsmG [Spirochaetes bacterium]|nr:MAG: 16S rRNA (guanine(527)-N(7))-methyltransferase RsmG [Spirochaetota bacterium]